MKLNRSSAFSLIELMIVVSILSVLASLAVSSYQASVIKTYIADGISSASEAKLAVSEYYQVNSTMTGASITDISTRYVERLAFATTSSTRGLIYIYYKDMVPGIGSTGRAAVILEGNANSIGNITWRCRSENNTYRISEQYLPASCR